MDNKKNKFLSMNKWFYAFLAAAVLFAGAIVAVLIIGLSGDDTPEPPVVEAPTEGAETGVYYYDAEKGEYILSLNSGNKFTIAGPDLNKSGVYTVAGSEITLDFVKDEDGTAKVTIADNVLSMIWNNTEMRFLKKVSFNVTFQTDGGSAIAGVSVVNGKPVAKPADPTKDGYAFIGWYADAAMTKAFNFATTTIAADTTVYAKWVKLEPGRTEYTVNFDLGYEGATAPTQTETINGKLYGLEAPEREGYTFAGWWISVYNDSAKLTYECTEDAAVTADTTLYALWIDNASTKLASPAVSVDGSTVTWNPVTNASSYTLTITAPDGTVTTKNVGVTSEKVDFAALAAGDYEISVVANSTDVTKNSDPAVRYYRNKSLERVSGYTVLDGALVIWNAVAGAEKYEVTVECGEAGHTHTAFDNGKQTFFNISNCAMQKGGIKITVVAKASGSLDSVATTYVYEKNLDAVGGLTYDEATYSFVWNRVENAAKYFVLVKCQGHTHALVDNGSSTSYSVKYCTGAISVEVYPASVGYNSPEATKLEYNKTTLPAPQNVVLSDKNLTWDAVAGATGYQVKIGDQTFPVTGNSYNLDNSGITFVGGTDYTISVMAVGTASSAFSDAIVTKIFAMTALSYNNKVVSWTPVIGATGYEVSVNGGAVETVMDATSYAVELTKAGVNTVRVRYIGGGDATWSTIEIYAYEVTYDSRSISGVEKEYLAIGDTMSMPTTFELAGYDFAGWYNTPAASSNGAAYPYTNFSENGDLVLYAAWTPKDYEVKLFGCENVENIENGTAVTVTYSKKFMLPIPVSESGDNFSGWYTANGEMVADAQGNCLKPYDVTRDTNVYASFDTGVVTYTLRSDGTYAASAGPNIKGATTVTIPAAYKGIAVTAILENGFYDQDYLEYVNIPDTIELIGAGAFGSCNILKAFNIYEVKTETPHKVVYFSDDGALLYYDEPSDETYLEIFPRGKEGHYEMSDEVDIVRDMAFEMTSISTIKFGKNVSYIAKKAFYSCMKLQGLEFATGGEVSLTIEENAFQLCKNVKTLVLPARLTGYSLSELDDFPALESVSIEDGNADYKSVDGLMCDQFGQKILYCPTEFSGNNGVFTPNKTVRTIGSNVFAKNKKLTEVVIPYYVEVIEANAFKGSPAITKVTINSGRTSALTVGSSAFANCAALATVNLGSGELPATTEIDEGVITFADNVFAGCARLGTVNVTGGINIATLGTNTFKGATILSKMNVAADVVIAEIGAGAFSGTAFLTFQLHPTTDKIGDGAFAGCKVLHTFSYAERATIPQFGRNVFSECVQLQNVVISAAQTEFDIGVFGETVKNIVVTEGNTTYATDGGVLYNTNYTTVIAYPRGIEGKDLSALRWDTITKIAPNAFKGIIKIESVVIGANVTEIGAGAFENCTKITSITFASNSYTNLTVAAGAFKGCTGITEITLPNGLTSIADSAFENCSKLKTVNLPAGVTTIGASAFRACSALANITLATGTTSVGDYAFYGCASLTALTLPETVQTIGAYAFYSTKMAEINMPKDLVSIGASAFAGTPITSVTMPEGVAIGKDAFKNCAKLTSVQLPANATEVGEGWFSGCTALASITLPTTVTVIGNNAFYNCKALTAITLHEGITTIGTTAFYAAGFTTVTIPASVTTIGAGAFNSSKITSVTFTPGDKALAIGSATDTTGVFQNTQLTGTVVLPDRATVLGAYAFKSATKMTGIDLANITVINPYTFQSCGITSIDLTGVTAIGTYAFSAAKLTAVTIPATVSVVAERAFYNCKSLTSLTLSEGVTEIGKYTFYNCSALNNVVIPTTVTKIAQYAFQSCTKMLNISFTKGGTAGLVIEPYAFNGTKFTKIELPARLTDLGGTAACSYNEGGMMTSAISIQYYVAKNVFNGNTVLQTVTVAEDSALTDPTYSSYDGIIYRNYDETTGDYRQFATLLFCPVARNNAVTIHKNVTLVERNAFNGTKATKITFENFDENDPEYGVPTLTIGRDYTKSNYSNSDYATFVSSTVTEISFPSHLKLVTSFAMYNLTKANLVLKFHPASLVDFRLRSIYNTKVVTMALPKLSSTAIQTFYNNLQLTTVTIAPGSTMTKLTNRTFYNCKALTAIQIPASVEIIDARAFESCSKLATVTFEEGSRLTTIGEYAFSGCAAMTSFVMPKEVRYVGQNAWSSCNNLTSITVSDALENGINQQDSNMFSSIFTLKEIIVPAGNKRLKSINGVLYDSKEEILYCYPRACTAELYLPETLITIERGALSSYQGSTLNLPSRLETIGSQAFSGMTNLTSITIPATVKTIGSSAFGACSSLATIIFEPGSQLTSVGGSAFAGTKITEISLPDNIEEMGTMVFSNCFSLETVILPAALAEIPINLFHGCGKLTNVTIQEGVTKILTSAFAGSGIKEITLPDSLLEIATSAFEGCNKLEKVHVSENARLDTIANRAFYNVASLTEMGFGGKLTSIGNNAFEGCVALTKVILPNSLTELGTKAFYDCTALNELALSASLTAVSANAFENCSAITAVAFGPSLTEIGTAAFKNCTALANVTFDPACTIDTIGTEVFYGTTALSAIALPTSVKVIGESAFRNSGIATLSLPTGLTTLSDNAFRGCENLLEVSIPNGLAEIGNYAFAECTSMTTLNLYSGLEEIGDFAFSGCTALTRVLIPATVERLGSNPFMNCTALSDFALDDNPNFKMHEGVLYNPTLYTLLYYPAGLTAESFTFHEDTREIAGGAFSGSQLKTIVIPEYITEIPASAFENSVLLERVTLSNATTTIGEAAFRGCASLNNVSIPGSVVSIGDYAFAGCASLTNDGFSITKNAKLVIGTHLFENCISLTDILPFGVFNDYMYAGTGIVELTIPSGELLYVQVNKNGSTYNTYFAGVFANCTKLTTVNWPKDVSIFTLGDAFFAGCTALTEITIPQGIRSLGDGRIDIGVFAGCLNLTTVNLPDDVYLFGPGCFENCVKLTKVNLNVNPEAQYVGGDRAFKNCVLFNDMTFVGAFNRYGSEMFSGCISLTGTVYFTSTAVEGMGAKVFAGCTGITGLDFNACKKGIMASEFDPQAFVGMNYENVHVYATSEEGLDGLNRTGVFDVFPAENLHIEGGKKEK